jgi:hypothetical protein
MAVPVYAQAHVRASSAMRGEVPAVRGQVAQNMPNPARPATRKTPASNCVPSVLSSISALRFI